MRFEKPLDLYHVTMYNKCNVIQKRGESNFKK